MDWDKIIVHFIEGSDVHDCRVPSTAPAVDITQKLKTIAVSLCELASSVFVLGFPRCGTYRERAITVNTEIRRLAKFRRWRYQGLSDMIYNENHIANNAALPLLKAVKVFN